MFRLLEIFVIMILVSGSCATSAFFLDPGDNPPQPPPQDTTPPKIEETSLSNGDILEGLIKLKAKATDSESGIDFVSFYIKRIGYTSYSLISSDSSPNSQGWYVVNFNTILYHPGNYRIKIYAFDKQQNYVSKTFDVIIPYVSFANCYVLIVGVGLETEVRFTNDAINMYKTFIGYYNVPPENIFFLSYRQVSSELDDSTTYRKFETENDLDDGISFLQQASLDDQVIIYWCGHGDRHIENINPILGMGENGYNIIQYYFLHIPNCDDEDSTDDYDISLIDWFIDVDDIDGDGLTDESFYIYDETRGELKGEELNLKLNTISCKNMLVFLGTCFSGDIGYQIQASNRAVYTATNFNLAGNVIDGSKNSVWPYYTWKCLTYFQDYSKADSDYGDNDGIVDMYEFYLYSKDKTENYNKNHNKTLQEPRYWVGFEFNEYGYNLRIYNGRNTRS